MDSYSRIVALLKVLLPLMALALLSTVFLISRGVDTEFKIPFAESELEERTRGQQVTAPFFSGMTPQGDEILVTGSLARPGTADQSPEIIDLDAKVKMADGTVMTVISDIGTVELDSDIASFVGNVEITSSSGIVIQTDRLNTALTGISGNSPGPVTGTSPIGDLTAGAMQFDTKVEGGPVHMLFNNGVKLIYQPQNSER